ncbi:glutaminyl-tRNA synthase (glutamine-hydrolyzing) subunit B [candidate division WOR-1 bacterium RIFOXYA2_FULL_36_21]|uniref:Aspartyl/glutamyl-tRNA(Asn/Gln) amidotransferase subunit B n=1 Tax=candidate division WOR-1 bacterium RIFOXYB2_FULL_36_35 TaxID=1802578 RepID=A0A1F4S0L8_UNCSA|nr:MAG: glutaminyl-tRNA synthase (glutamine-hydrolyzing) subunit B [candidate division WOR-1 bacterium RIFOXYA2_FULL_36_21]OGC13982.1 MAG: glutaminyl-tRNA synthase (glutamine-hydrolyzing) subunit B [candidate division WOR-1 bacterium RIFOXYB2_FULL_36_35]OGC16605.1 MAG: glutaminyl-tRNA synthase (glutamine-hydrolyzing) subunit B [candidate division WOR-1 bacterium RIFOXYA12_FULL_36_13]
MPQYETVIGLEVHAQLKTESKMFCGCANNFGDQPNTNICPVCTGQPGTLPVINKKAIELAIKTALATNCKINNRSVFARKNYFYPDLPKDYQISQFDLPLAEHGFLEIKVDENKKRVGITRIHLEEDAGKLVHKGSARIMDSDYSLADYNRAATPLMEIVSEPDLRTPEEAKAYMEKLAHLLEYIGVCDAKMEEGSLRCDANISIRPVGQKEFGTKTEIKNMNSFKAVMKALKAEELRHREVVDEGGIIIQETRFYSEETEKTKGMRTKEYSHDYRYFPEPDLVPIAPTKEWIEEIRKTVGELPEDKKVRFAKNYGISDADAFFIISNPKMADFLEETARQYANPKTVANWLVGEITAFLKEEKIGFGNIKLTPEILVEMLQLIDKGTISRKVAKEIILPEILIGGKSIQEIIKEKGLTQISNEEELVAIVQEVIRTNPKQVEQFKSGKEAVLQFFVGQIMKATKGRANPDAAQKTLKKELKK